VIFRPDLAAKVLAGEKTVTRRQMSDNPRSPWFRGGCSIEAGRSYAVCPGRGECSIARIHVWDVQRSQLAEMGDDDAVAEGFASMAEFAKAWTAINLGAFDPREWVWRVRFTLDEATP
jgi:hypothetical protein